MHTRKLVVLTGFEPFADFAVNPSWEAAKALDQKETSYYKIEAFQIPLKYREIKPSIESIIDRKLPTVLIGLGQSYRPVISLEKVALNFADLAKSNIIYNCGTIPKDEILDPSAPAAYFTNLPIRKILNRLRQNQIPAEISYSAGTFGCNQIFFHMMNKIAKNKLEIAAGFIHVPSLQSQAVQLQDNKKISLPSMNLHTLIKAAEIALETTMENMLS
ncbi:MAG: pyroglutamyl-peptidase I [Candidatus Bathyarchaeota archaeon]|nr:pyroglutamyl-peptidase I [Candidatus Bathyarchaeota archaeon]